MKRKLLAVLLSAALTIPTAAVHLTQNKVLRADEAQEESGTQVDIDPAHFPDNNFRQYLMDNYDTKAPKAVLTADEIAEIKKLDADANNISSVVGVQYLTSLETLICQTCTTQKLSLSGMTSLVELCCSGSSVEELDLSGCTSLKWVECNAGSLKSIDVSGCTSLEELECLYDKLTKVDLSGLPKLVRADLTGSTPTSVDASNCPNLESLLCGLDEHLESLDVSGCPKLSYLDCVYSNLSKLDVSDCTALTILKCGNVPLSELDLSGNPNLVQLICPFTKLSYLDVSKCPKLMKLECYCCEIERIKMNNNPYLKSLLCFSNPLTDLEIGNCPYLLQLIADVTPDLVGMDYSGKYCEFMRAYKAYFEDGHFSYECIIGFDEGVVLWTTPHSYLITVTSDANGTASASATYAKEDEEIILTAQPDPGYVLKEWQVIFGGVTVTDNKFIVGHENVMIKAVFEPAVRNVVVTTDGNGTASASVSQGTMGTKVSLTAVANSGYQFKEWKVVRGDVTITDNSFVIAYEDVEIMAIFEALPTTPDPAKDPSFEDFVERLYVVALGRASEPEGKAFWVDQVVNKGFTGADCARFFMLGAPEFLGRGLTDDEFVEVLYKTYFDRDSEPDGKAYWMGRLASGTERAVLVEQFIESVEWCNVCAMYGVKSGALYHKATAPSKNAVKFATRLYTCCLGRDPEADGLNYWALALTNLDATGYQAASLFFTLPEFVGLKTTNEEYLTRLYTTFMGREPEADGFAYWLGLLNGGTSREDVMKAFAGCPEFQEICNQYGIVRGEI